VLYGIILLENIPIVIDKNTVFTIALFAVLSAVAAAYLPALRAGKQKPVGLLRKI
jgi:ABC-type lipoprotein release transport system permease subunit